MVANSKIEWTDHTFNPWVGCQSVSPGCDNCYAENMLDTRFGRVKWGPHGERQRTSDAIWKTPLKWHKHAGHFRVLNGRRQRVFCASLCDVFDNKAPQQWRDDLWKLIEDTPQLDWLLLTKRPETIVDMMGGKAPPNVWLGTTCEDQRRADHRVPLLLRAAATLGVRITFLSCEPLLGPLDLTRIRKRDGNSMNALRNVSRAVGSNVTITIGGRTFERDGPVEVEVGQQSISWVISGGESGPNARPSHPDWHRKLRDQCAEAGVAFFMKQMGGRQNKNAILHDLPEDLRSRSFPT